MPGSLDQILAHDGNVAAEELRAVIARAVAAGGDEASDAYYASSHSDGHTFGTNRWRFTQAELFERCIGLPGAKPIRSGSLKVVLLPVSPTRSVVIYPLCLGNERVDELGGVKIRPSDLRRLLFQPAQKNLGLQLAMKFTGLAEAVGAPDSDPAATGLDRDIAAAEDEALADVEAQLAEEAEVPLTLVVAYTSTPKEGVLQIIVGQAEMAASGHLRFQWSERLPVPTTDVAVRPQPVTTGPVGPDAATFTSTPEPVYDLSARDVEANPVEARNAEVSSNDQAGDAPSVGGRHD